MNDQDSRECLLTIREMAFLAATTPRIIERLVSFEIVCPECNEPEPAFAPETLEYVRKAIRIHDHLGISWSAVGFVMELVNRIEALESGENPRVRRKDGKCAGH